jgi:hypothetical protein
VGGVARSLMWPYFFGVFLNASFCVKAFAFWWKDGEICIFPGREVFSRFGGVLRDICLFFVGSPSFQPLGMLVIS